MISLRAINGQPRAMCIQSEFLAYSKGDPIISADLNSVPGGTIVDPQTGLPVDLEKGTGAGGTDSGTMPGYHSREADASGHDRSRDINQL